MKKEMKKEIKLDKLDYKILYELDKDVRTPYAAMAKELKVSKQTIKNRIEKLVENKSIDQFITIINIANFGILPSQIFISLHKSSQEKKEEIANYLINNPKVSQVAVCEGVYDFFFGLSASSHHELDQELSKLYNLFSDQIKDRKLLLLIDTKLYPRDFLIDKEREFAPKDRGFHKKKFSPQPVKKIDHKILSLLANDARISFTEISQKLNLPIQTVINRYKYLKENKIIIGNMYFFSLDLFIEHEILLKFSSLTPKLERHLLGYFASKPNVIFVAKVLGEYDLAIAVETKTFDEFKNFISDFKETFAAELKSFIPLMVTKYPKLNFSPSNLLKQN